MHTHGGVWQNGCASAEAANHIINALFRTDFAI
jgi:hypothetical protein